MKTLSFETDAMRRIYAAVDSIDWQSYADDPEPRHLVVEVPLRHDSDVDPTLSKNTFIVRVWQRPYIVQPTPINIYFHDAPVPIWKIAEVIKYHIDQHHDLARYGLAANKVGTEGVVVTKLQHRYDHLFDHWQTETNLKRSFETDPFKRLDPIIDQIDWDEYNDTAYMGTVPLVLWDIWGTGIKDNPTFTIHIWLNRFDDRETLRFNTDLSPEALLGRIYGRIMETMRPQQYPDISVVLREDRIDVVPRDTSTSSLRLGFEANPFLRIQQLIDRVNWSSWAQYVASTNTSSTPPVIAMFGWESFEESTFVDVQPMFGIFLDPHDGEFTKIYGITEGIDFVDLRLMTFDALNNAAKLHGIKMMISGNTIWATDEEQYRQTYD